MSHVTFFADRRGVSPLIATVLLIAFAVALGAVIMNWGRGFVQERTEEVSLTTEIETACALDVRIDVSDIGTTPQVCYGGSGTAGYIEFTLENEGSKDISEITVVVSGALGAYNNRTLNNTAIPAGGLLFENLTYDFSQYGDIRFVRFVPRVSIGGVVTSCTGSPLQKDISEIRNCTG